MAYPASISTLADKSDGPGNVIYAAHINSIHTALRDLRTVLGDDPEGNLANVETRLDAIVDNDGHRVLPANFRIVAKGNAQYTTIQSAIDSISDQSDSKPYTVLIYPGSYNEKITTKNYVNLASLCQHSVFVNAPIGEYALDHHGGNLFNIDFMGQIGTGAAYIQTTLSSYINFCRFYASSPHLFHGFSGNNYLTHCDFWNTADISFYLEGGIFLFDCCTFISAEADAAVIDGGTVNIRFSNMVSNTNGIKVNAGGNLYARFNMWEHEPYGDGTISLGTMTNTNCDYF